MPKEVLLTADDNWERLWWPYDGGSYKGYASVYWVYPPPTTGSSGRGDESQQPACAGPLGRSETTRCTAPEPLLTKHWQYLLRITPEGAGHHVNIKDGLGLLRESDS